MVGRLGRPTCATPNRPALKRDAAQAKLWDLVERVQNGEPAMRAEAQLGISAAMAWKLGFRTKAVRHPHGTQARLTAGCRCWRCRQAGGISLPRGPRTGPARKAAVLDWLAYRDPDTGEALLQVEVARLSGVAQGAVSRIVRLGA